MSINDVFLNMTNLRALTKYAADFNTDIALEHQFGSKNRAYPSLATFNAPLLGHSKITPGWDSLQSNVLNLPLPLHHNCFKILLAVTNWSNWCCQKPVAIVIKVIFP